MRKLHQMEIPDPLVSEGEYIEYTANNGMVFNVLAVRNESRSCHECTFYKFKKAVSAVDCSYYICDCGPRHNNNLCYKGINRNRRRDYCRFVDIGAILEDL